MAEIPRQHLNDAAIHRLWSRPKELAKVFGTAIKEGRRSDTAEMVLIFGDMFERASAPQIAYDLCRFYLKKWGRCLDLQTGEILSLASIVSSNLGNEARAEALLLRLIKRASDHKWESLQRRALQSLGVLRHQQGREQERDALYSKALNLALATGDKIGESQLYNNIGAALLDAGKRKDGEAMLRKSIAIKIELGFDLDAAGSMATLGGVLGSSKRFVEARRVLDEAARIGRKCHAFRLLATVFYNRGKLAEDMGRLEDAPKLMRLALRYAERANDVPALKLCHQGLAVIYYRLKQPPRAASHFRILAPLCDKLGDIHGTAMAHHDLGSMLALQGKLDLATDEYEIAAKLFLNLNDHYWHAMSLLSCAKVASTDSARVHLLHQVIREARLLNAVGFPTTEVTDLAIKSGDRKLIENALTVEHSRYRVNDSRWPTRLAMLGAMASQYKHWSVAERIFLQAIERRGHDKDYEAAGAIGNDLGIAQLEQGRVADALSHFRGSLTIGRRLKNRVIMSQAAHNIGETYRRVGKQQLAIRYLRVADEAADSIGDVNSQAGTLHSLGLAYLSADRLEDAESAFLRVRRQGRQLRDKFLLGQAEMGFAAVAYERGNFEKAYKHYSEARDRFTQAGRADESTAAMYNMGTACSKTGRYRQASNLMLKSATLASDAGDLSMLSTALQGLAFLGADIGKVAEAAKLIAQAILIALSCDDSNLTYPTAISSFSGVMHRVVSTHNWSREKFTDSVIAQFGSIKMLNKQAEGRISKHLRDISAMGE